MTHPSQLILHCWCFWFCQHLYLLTIHNQTTKSFRPSNRFSFALSWTATQQRPLTCPNPYLIATILPTMNSLVSALHSQFEGDDMEHFRHGWTTSNQSSHWGACVPNGLTPPLYCIGPMIVDVRKRGASDDALSKCLLWLYKHPSQSFMFFCFGGKGAFPVPQLKEIANDLERSIY